MIWTAAFWIGAAERAVKTAAQAAAALITVDQVITSMDWTQIALVSATAAIYSLLTSLADPVRATATPTSRGTHAKE